MHLSENNIKLVFTVIVIPYLILLLGVCNINHFSSAQA